MADVPGQVSQIPCAHSVEPTNRFATSSCAVSWKPSGRPALAMSLSVADKEK